MIAFNRFKLDNGLTVIHHHDPTTPIAVVNVLYDVGARDESEDRTGFAHLFEHLMFGGSVNIPDFDAPLQFAGGESNAFTSNDITNYYDTLPVQNIETALWLESDRMLSLAFTPKSLEVQRNVVIEEFKQRYLNQPYGDVWLELRPLAYHEHPYKWATIGKEIKHIEEAEMDDVKAFFKAHYHPANAILCVAGNISLEKTTELINKWFGDIPASLKPVRMLPREPQQNEYREKTIERAVPNDAFYYAFKMPERRSFEYYVADIISDALGREKSSRLYGKLKKELKLVTSINAYITGSIDEGLLVIEGKLSNGVTFEQVETALWETLAELNANPMSDEETARLLIKIRTAKEFQEQGLLNRAMNLCIYELLGDANGVNEENALYQSVTAKHIQELGKTMLHKENCSVLRVKAIQA
ncbi:MAG: peptidase M16 [Candidatus Fluviicola riflensis]|nr:MAG: peptidase M16 [Candidatus Fluviicola riflensis]OGS78873.1 MAG: peptidase M16 [Candidatus Fluviicola riflensis]OGS85895.1 MAG: peptidase M16 [Fluviicola sp. RIFCSPHIGHO2_12_FULL_43_24]OGS86304.1 MAG: peptidase M16 [Fluviicola sp. RIFCSPHIGHO2_01_FULL_43_53]